MAPPFRTIWVYMALRLIRYGKSECHLNTYRTRIDIYHMHIILFRGAHVCYKNEEIWCVFWHEEMRPALVEVVTIITI